MLIVYALLVAVLLGLRLWGQPVLHAEMGEPAGSVAVIASGFLLALSAGLLLDRLLRRVYWSAYFNAVRGYQAPSLLRDLTTAVLLVLAVSIWLYVDLDFSPVGLLAASGATVVVIGLALQAMILDVFSGLSISLDRSYQIGDWLTVYSDTNRETLYGKVEGMTWRCTILRLEDGRSILLPNRVVTSNPVINHSSPKTPKRLSVELCLDVRIPAQRAIRLLLGETYRALDGKGLALDPPPSVLLARVGSDASAYLVRFYADPDRISPSQACSRVLAALHDAASRARLPRPVQHIEIAEPTARVDEDVAAREALEAIPLFAETLEPDQLAALAARCRPITYPQGAVLMTQGAVENAMAIILEGAARVSVSSNGPATATPVAVLANGDIVGEMSLMTGAPRSATVTALTPLRALIVTKEAIEPLLDSAPELLERFSRILSERDAALHSYTCESKEWALAERDLLGLMRAFFSRTFSGGDRHLN